MAKGEEVNVSDEGVAGGIEPGLPTGTPHPDHEARHRREGVPLDGAPDLGLYTAPAQVTAEPVDPAAWSADTGPYVPPSPEPPAYPGPPSVSEFQPSFVPPVDPADFAPPADPQVAPPVTGFEQFGENLDTGSTG